MKDISKMRMGQIIYANSWPLFYQLERSLPSTYEMIRDIPVSLNRMLASGELDVSGISSFSYGQYADDYILLPELSVGSVGEVNSILLFSKEPLEKVRPRTVSLSSSSATSVNLLKIMMQLRYDCLPEYDVSSQSLEQMLSQSDAALLIGDPAIVAARKYKQLHIVDLGAAWHEWTGLGMTYAVVAARKQAYLQQKPLLEQLHEALLINKTRNSKDLSAIINDACLQLGGDRAYWTRYFSCLQFDFNEQLQEGLALYYRYAQQLGFLSSAVPLTFLNDKLPNR
ncbi:menaquinone biosynthetic enzyme MqnA/MqnD family protein [Paenibacillus yanchengensis]|uniref:Chorismate dehydratase n=1 Tax=Paenibacillus yanchengensis TaxID=2035833 RepID=A0ABW4YJX9_9BACL